MFEKTYSIIKKSEITFDTELSKDYVSDGTKALIKNCSVLMLPLENFRKQSPLCFNEGFRNLFFYLKENLPEHSIDLCIDKEKIEEIALHSAEFHLGKFLIENIIAPVFVGLISDYLKKKLFAKEDDIASIDLIIADKNTKDKSTEISFKGKPSELIDTLNRNVAIYTKDGHIKNLDEGCHKIDVLS